MDAAAKAELLEMLTQWRSDDEPLVEAIGNTLARWQRLDSQELARHVVSTVIEVLERELPTS